MNNELLNIPERKRILIAILGDKQNNNDKLTAWNEFKRMVKGTEYENDLLNDEAFFTKKQRPINN